MIIQDFLGQIGKLNSKKTYILPKRHFWPPGVSINGLTPWSNGIYFQEILLCLNFKMYFEYYSIFWGQIVIFFVKKCIFGITCHVFDTCHIWPPGVLMYKHTTWSNGIFLKNYYYASISIWHLLWLFNISGSTWHIFVKIRIFCSKCHIWPPAVLLYILTAWNYGI